MPEEVKEQLMYRLRQIEVRKRGYDDSSGDYSAEEIRLAKQFGIDVELLREFKRNTETGDYQDD